MRTSVVGFIRANYFIASLLAVSVLLIASVTLADIVSGLSATGSSTNVTLTNLTVAKPSGVAQGDFMLANIAINDGSMPSVTAPSGWTQILRTDYDTNISIVSFWKVAGASEPSSYTWQLSPQTRAEGGITRYTGVDTTNPIDAAAGNFGHGNTATTSAITTTGANEEVVALYAAHVGGNNHDGAYFSTSTGMTEKYDDSFTTAGPSIAADDAVQVSAGTTGSKSTIITGPQKDWASQLIALRVNLHQISVETGTNGTASYALCTKANPVTFSKTVGAASTLLVVHVNSGLETGVSYAGIAMTEATSSSIVSTWYLVNPPSGTNSVVVDFSAFSGVYASAVSYTGTDTSNPLGAMSIAGDQGGDPSVPITTNNDNSMIDDNLFYNLAQSLTPNAPQVLQAGVLCSGNSAHAASVLQTATHGAYTLGWTHSGPDTTWQDIAVEIKAAN
jgi:hypothetical protein